jgi:cytochrome c biogenesis protein CcmG/thiol:disulfide interchange protein DsbE
MSEMNNMDAAPPRRGVPVWAQVIVWLALLVLLVILSFGLSKSANDATPVQTGAVIPAFKLKTFDTYGFQGTTNIALADFKGKVVVMNFWASWCVPCEQEAADLEAAWKFYEPTGKVVFLGIDHLDTEPEALAYLTKFSVTYPTGPDLQGAIAKMFRISGVPESYIIDQNGKLVSSQIGPFTSEAQIRDLIDPLIK